MNLRVERRGHVEVVVGAREREEIVTQICFDIIEDTILPGG